MHAKLARIALFTLVTAWPATVAPQRALAQDATEPPGVPPLFFESVEVNVVNVEVMVTDVDGNPVRGLTRDDFEIFEDRQPVEITNFFAVEDRQTRPGAPSTGPAPTDAAASTAEAAGNADTVPSTATNPAPATGVVAPSGGPQTKGLLLVVFIDNLNLRPENRNRALASLRSYLDRGLDPRDRVMFVVFDGSMQVAQNFTNDPVVLNATLDRLSRETGRFIDVDGQRQRLMRDIERTPLVPRPPANTASGDRATFEAAERLALHHASSLRAYTEVRLHQTRDTLAALDRFGGSLAGLPGRKAILYVSDGLPLRPGEAEVEGWRNKYEQWATFNAVPSVVSEGLSLAAAPTNMSSDFRALVQKASEEGVTFYPLSDAQRLRAGQLSAEYAGSSTADGRGAFSRDVTTLERIGLETPLMMMAEGTGGVAFTQSSNLSGLLDRMVSDFSTFYSLGYSPPSPGERKFREISVRVKREGVVVRHLKGHRAVDPVEHMENFTLSSLYYGFEDNPLGVELSIGQHNETVGGQYRIPLIIKFPFARLALLPQQGTFAGRLKAFVVVQDEEGKISPFKHILLPIEIPAASFEQAQDASGAYQVDLVMRKGKNRVSVGVRDEVAKIEATTHLDVTIGINSPDAG